MQIVSITVFFKPISPEYRNKFKTNEDLINNILDELAYKDPCLDDIEEQDVVFHKGKYYCEECFWNSPTYGQSPCEHNIKKRKNKIDKLMTYWNKYREMGIIPKSGSYRLFKDKYEQLEELNIISPYFCGFIISFEYIDKDGFQCIHIEALSPEYLHEDVDYYWPNIYLEKIKKENEEYKDVKEFPLFIKFEGKLSCDLCMYDSESPSYGKNVCSHQSEKNSFYNNEYDEFGWDDISFKFHSYWKCYLDKLSE
jgi:hypothetical protein